jgi:hypothetical protein
MPLNLNLDPKPLLRFAQPDGLTVFTDEASKVDILLSPGVVGKTTVTLLCLADEVAFRVGNQLKSHADFELEFDQADEHHLLRLQFVLLCSNPSDQDILIRFDAQAVNHAGQQSPPIPQLPVTLKPRQRNGNPLSPNLLADTILPSEVPPPSEADPTGGVADASQPEAPSNP